MKTLISSLIIAFAVTMSSATFAQTSNAVSFTPNATENSRFFIQARNTGKVDVTVLKPEGSKLTIQVVDTQGITLATKFIAKHNPLTRTIFDLNELPDGTYHIVILEGSSKQVKDVILNTKSSDFRSVNLS